MYIYHALINALSAHMIHINLNVIFYTHVEHSPTETIYIKYYKCNGAVERRTVQRPRQRSRSKMETTAGVWQQSGFTFSAADNFQHTQNPHAHA